MGKQTTNPPKRTTCRNRKPETRRFLEYVAKHRLNASDYPAGEHSVWRAAAWSLVAHRDFLREMDELQILKRETDDEHGDERRRIIDQLWWDGRGMPGADQALSDFRALEERASDRGQNRLLDVRLGWFVADEETKAEYAAMKRKHRAVLGSPVNAAGDTILRLALNRPIDDSFGERAEQLQHELSERVPFPDKPTEEDINRIARRLRHLSSELGLLISP